ncbi:MAG: type III pantothenate kinase [Gemmatimonadota bacterium]
MVLVVDVGNTETVIGLFPPGSLQALRVWRISTPVPRTPDEYELLLHGFLDPMLQGGELTQAVVGSVVPSLTEAILEALQRFTPTQVLRVDADTPLPISLEVDEPSTVGADRIVNTLAVAQLFRKDSVVVDLGTATTYDCITAEGQFRGGVIAPGVLAGQEWLAQRTAKLPRVELVPPRKVIGTRTETCLHSGIFYSSVDAMDGIVERIQREWGEEPLLVVATGGLASVLGPHARTIHRVEPALTLMGLVLAGAYVAESGPAGLDSLVHSYSSSPAHRVVS